MKAFASLALVLVLAACAAPSNRELRTDSDQTAGDRRATVRLELAQGYFASGQYTTALDELKQALAVKPEMREAITLRGLIYAAMGEAQLAEESFRRSLALYPTDPDVLHNYGWFLCQQQRWPAADAQFDLALAQASYRAPQRTLLAKGVCEARAGRMKAAERSLSRAFELDAGNPAISVNLAEVLYRNGELERARFYIKRVNAVPEQVNAQSLWLALRVEHKLGNGATGNELAAELRKRFPKSPEVQFLDQGRFDE
jgi:type IV pilus assembly protein PilF